MEHLVRYTTTAGETRYEEVGSLEAAVSLVERLRNEDDASDAQVFRPVPIEFKAYYKVVVAEGEPSDAAPRSPAPIDEPPPGAMPLSPPKQPSVQVHEEPAVVEDGDPEHLGEDGNRRSSLFSRGG